MSVMPLSALQLTGGKVSPSVREKVPLQGGKCQNVRGASSLYQKRKEKENEKIEFKDLPYGRQKRRILL